MQAAQVSDQHDLARNLEPWRSAGLGLAEAVDPTTEPPALEALTEEVNESTGLHRWELDSRPVRRWLGAAIAMTQLRHAYAWIKVIDSLERDP